MQKFENVKLKPTFDGKKKWQIKKMVIKAWAIAISGFVFTKQFEITNWKWGHLHTV